ncbi:MAG: hypothetical protein J6T64_02995 [Bacteroidaceae bacterium]|nr:hypothetical protein [Bacteroidaceae bacterium]
MEGLHFNKVYFISFLFKSAAKVLPFSTSGNTQKWVKSVRDNRVKPVPLRRCEYPEEKKESGQIQISQKFHQMEKKFHRLEFYFHRLEFFQSLMFLWPRLLTTSLNLATRQNEKALAAPFVVCRTAVREILSDNEKK